MKESAGRVLIIVQNLPVPLDRRVWLEAQTLCEHGYTVSVICPKSKEYRQSRQELDGVAIYRYRMPFESHAPVTYFFEFLYAWIATALLSLTVWWQRGFDVIHACNPPDTFFLLAWLYRPFGKKFLFDHHDLSPEMFLAKFKERKGWLYRGLLLLEKLTLKTAEVVLSTNESYREVALHRGRKAPDQVFVVRTGPDLERLKPVAPSPELKRDYSHLVCYLGEMCSQDGVDYLLRAAHYLVHQLRRRDVGFALIGGGPAVPALKEMCHDMGLDGQVWFTGRLSDAEVCRYLSTADVCVDPDPWSEWANNSTMNKVLEYMTFARPIVSFDLKEIRNSARRAAVYVRPNDVRKFGEKISELLDDPDTCRQMGELGRSRILYELSWSHTSPPLLVAYARIFNRQTEAANEAEIEWKIKESLRQIQISQEPSLK